MGFFDIKSDWKDMSEEYTLEILEKKIGYTFLKKELITQAMTHSSFSNEQKVNRQKDYERLEFLGDAVLELVSSQFLFEEMPDKTEGDLTKMRSSLVCEPSLAYCAKELNLGEYIRLGKGEEATGGRMRDSITSDVMEAIIGAIYLDGGFDKAKEFIYKFILSDLENKKLFYDSKTILQEIVQGKNNGTLHYEVIAETGPDHDKLFLVEARIDDRKISEGNGRTKKAAEQQAAYQAILKIKK